MARRRDVKKAAKAVRGKARTAKRRIDKTRKTAGEKMIEMSKRLEEGAKRLEEQAKRLEKSAKALHSAGKRLKG